MSLRILGIDPGPELSGVALLEFDGLDARPTFVDGGHVPSLVDHALHWLVGHGVDVVAIETAEGFGHGVRFNPDPVIQGARRGGGWEWLALSKGIDIWCMTAREARGFLCRRTTASDAMVAVAVLDLVLEVSIANTHVRDACAVAAAAGFRRLNRWPALSQRAEHRLLELAEARRARVQEKRKRLRAHRIA